MRIFDSGMKVLLVALLMATVSDAHAAGRRAKKSAPSNRASNGASGEEAPKPSPQGGDSVLDFEGDVIEGQRRRPDLFLQTETQNLTLDAILYLRRDFNDFHSVERLRRPGYFERRKGE
jgi:hypothetical protein